MYTFHIGPPYLALFIRCHLTTHRPQWDGRPTPSTAANQPPPPPLPLQRQSEPHPEIAPLEVRVPLRPDEADRRSDTGGMEAQKPGVTLSSMPVMLELAATLGTKVL